MLFVAGLYALFTMPRREDPKITIHIGIVAAVYPGATAREVEDQVTRKIEERLFRFAEVRRDKTYSTTRNGMVVINVELNKSVRDTDEFWSKLRLDMAQLKATELPAGVLGPVVDSDFGDTVAVLIAVHGGQLRSKRAEGLRANGGDGAARDSCGLQDQAHRRSKGRDRHRHFIGAALAVCREPDEGDGGAARAQYSRSLRAAFRPGRARCLIESGGRFQTEDQIRQVMVDVSPAGQPVYHRRSGHCGTCIQGSTRICAHRRRADHSAGGGDARGQQHCGLRQHAARHAEEMQTTLPPDVKLDLVADQPKVVSERIRDFFREFGIAIVAVILVTMLLLPLRVALVSAIAIPVSVAITFGMLDACGIELQQVSISALIVVLGMVVDNAIVIVDNYVELLDRKVPIDEAAERCATEMAVPVLTATLAIIAAFAAAAAADRRRWASSSARCRSPSPFRWATSFFVAMLLTPLMARFFIRQGLVDHSTGRSAASERKLTPLDHMQRYYNRVITWAMQNKQAVLVASVLAFVAGIGILALVPQLLFPLAERDQFVMDVWLPEGAKIEATDAAVRRIEAVLSREPLVKKYTSFLGDSAPRFYYNVNPQAPAANYAQILVNTNKREGNAQAGGSVAASGCRCGPEAKVFVKELQQGQIMEAPVEVRISGDDIATLETLGNQVEDVLRHTPGATYIHTRLARGRLAGGRERARGSGQPAGIDQCGHRPATGGGL